MADKVIIVGGGIGGLACALALLKRGLDVEVYEQATELKEVGAGIQISSNGTRVLYALGLEDALKPCRCVPRQAGGSGTGRPARPGTGSISARRRSERYGTPHIMLHRADLHGLLADAVAREKPDAVKLGRRFAAVSQDAPAPR